MFKTLNVQSVRNVTLTPPENKSVYRPNRNVTVCVPVGMNPKELMTLCTGRKVNIMS